MTELQVCLIMYKYVHISTHERAVSACNFQLNSNKTTPPPTIYMYDVMQGKLPEEAPHDDNCSVYV